MVIFFQEIALDTWDTAITQTAKLIEAKRNLKKGLMQQLIAGKRRLLEFREPWLKKKLGGVFRERKETNHGGASPIA